MKIKEFVESMKNVKMQSEQLAEKLKKMLDVKEYIGISEKKNLIERIINDSIYYEDGIYKIDGIEKYIHTIMYTIETYTNLELSDNLETDYDMLCYPCYKDGECWDSGITMKPNKTKKEYRKDARWFLETFVDITNAHEKGEISYE